MALDRLTQVTSSGITTTISFRSSGINVSGAVTATSFVGEGSGIYGLNISEFDLGMFGM